MSSSIKPSPVAVIGAGPVGLAAAAELAERGIDFVVLESGGIAGAAISSWGHVRLFSPWRYNLAPAARRLLEADGWTAPDLDALPTGADLVDDYLRAAGEAAGARPSDPLRQPSGGDQPPTASTGSAPLGRDTSPVPDPARRRQRAHRPRGHRRVRHLAHPQRAGRLRPARPRRDRRRAVHRLGAARRARRRPGPVRRPAHPRRRRRTLGRQHAARPRAARRRRTRHHGQLGDPHRHPGPHLRRRRTPTRYPPAGRSAPGCARSSTPGRITPASPASPSHPSTTTGDTVSRSRAPTAAHDSVTVDRIVSATGFRPDHTIAAELRLDLDPIMGATRALAPLIDPNEHSCGTVPPHGVDELAHPEPGYYAVGAKSYGRAPTFLMATGYEQARSVVAALAGDWDAARDVQLDLPETGVCSSTNALGESDGGSCCGTPTGQSAPHGLATGITGGLLSLPILDTAPTATGGCCAG